MAEANNLITVINDEEVRELRQAVEDLQWKIDYEKGLYNEMVELLENKVANYLVQINTFQENEFESKTKLDSQEIEIEQM